jgi:hypothetical protein
MAVALALALAPSASAYQPSPSSLYVAENPTCNKRPCVLYPKSAQLPSGQIVAAFENSQGDPVGQTMPLYKSDDHGTTWQKLTDLKAPAYMTSDPRYAKYTSNWTNPYLYVLPHDVGSLKAGTLLLASVVSGDDYYYKERKAADPDWQPTGDGDRKDVSIALYASTDDGATWSFENIIAAGGWQGGGGSNRSAANTNRQQDPVWEPHLFARGSPTTPTRTSSPASTPPPVRRPWPRTTTRRRTRTTRSSRTRRGTAAARPGARPWSTCPARPWPSTAGT